MEDIVVLIIEIFAENVDSFLPILGIMSALNFLMTFLFTVMFRGAGEAGRPRL